MKTSFIISVLYLFSIAGQVFASDRLLTVDETVEFPVYNTRLGGQGSTAIYTMDPDKAWIVQEAEYQLALGSDTFKFMLRPYINKYSGTDIYTQEMPPYSEPVHSLVDRAKNVPAFRKILNMPFRYTMIWAFPVAGLNNDQTGIYASESVGINLGDGYSETEARMEYQELYDLTVYLMQTYQNTGRSFLFGNWEGDWVLLAGQEELAHNKDKENKRNFEPSPEKIEAMRAWFANRQKAVEDARNSLPNIKGVNVYHYVEVNHFENAMDDIKSNGDNRLVNAVLPNIKVDAVSYSAWNGTNKTKQLPKLLHDHLDFIEKNAKFTGHWPFEKAVFVGEYGRKKGQETAKVITAAASWGCPFTLYWCILPNYPTNNHYMIEKDGSFTESYFVHHNALAKINAHKDITRMYLHRNPTETELNSFIANVENIDISDVLSQTLNKPAFAKLTDNRAYLQALFQQILLIKDYNIKLFSTLLDDLNNNNRSRWEILLYLLDCDESKAAVSETDFSKWLYSNVILKQQKDISKDELDKTEMRLKKENRSAIWMEFLNSAESQDAALKTRYKNTQAEYKDWVYENTVSEAVYNHFIVDFRSTCR